MGRAEWVALVVGWLVLALAVVGLLLTRAQARSLPLPEEQWTEGARLWLARCQVAEAGWESHRDHDAIAWVLARRWSQYINHPAQPPRSVTFEKFIQMYSVPLQGEPVSRRQKWVRQLSFDAEQPADWPPAVSWLRHAPLWDAVLVRADEWSRGTVPDPSAGVAMHWGGRTDKDPPPRAYYWWEPLQLGTRNTFYRIRRRHGARTKADK